MKMLEKIHQHVQIATRCENLDACLSLKDGDLIFARLPGELLWYRGQVYFNFSRLSLNFLSESHVNILL